MSKAKKFFGKSYVEKIKDDDGEVHDFKINPFKGKDLDMFIAFSNINNDPKMQADAAKEAFAKVWRDNIPDTTDDELDEISLNVYNQVMQAIEKVNGIK